MKLYAGIDLHSSNNYTAILDEEDNVVFSKRLPNDLDTILFELGQFQEQLEQLSVESTFNWYWLVDGLQNEGYCVALANPAAMQQYEGLKYTDDKHDARWLAHMLRLGILPCGYIYPKEGRGVRDLLRKRMKLVQQRTDNILSIQSQFERQQGIKLSVRKIKQLTESMVDDILKDPLLALAVKSNLRVIQTLDAQVDELEKVVKKCVKPRPEYHLLMTVPGIGEILAMTIMLETGDIKRFKKSSNYSSYCRCVKSERRSNNKKKGTGNSKNGNKYLCWAFVEAAHFAIRYNDSIKRFYQRKLSRSMEVIAIKSVANKLAKACFHIMRNRVPFEISQAFRSSYKEK